MARIKIEVPVPFIFSTAIPVRITDINYGGHVGNDTILSLLHEARLQFLNQYQYTEMNVAGVALIMSDVAIEFKNELFYGDKVLASVALSGISKVSFDLYYKLEKETNGKKLLVALAKTGMVCFNYDLKKMVPVPTALLEIFTH